MTEITTPDPNTNSNAPTTKVYFGVAFELAGKTISLDPKNAIQDLQTKGLEVELPPGERVYLGTVGESLVSILGTLGVDDVNSFLNTGADDDDPDAAVGTIKKSVMPDISALQNATDLVFEAGLYVDAFHVRIPGKASNDASSKNQPPKSANKTGQLAKASKEKTAYTIGLSAEWQGDAGQLIDGIDLKLKGIYLKVSNQ